MSDLFGFEIEHECPDTNARAGRLSTPHGDIATPVYMPVGTSATVKGMLPENVAQAGGQIVLANTYHLYLRPGEDIVRQAGGLHKFMNWPKPILTDSGGYQVFSLAGTNDITDEGVSFKSHIDGSRHFISPEKAMQIQNDLGADIIMAFDECCSYDAGYEYAQHSIQRTHEWLIRCIASHKNDAQALFGIVQGGMHSELRRQSAEQICSHDLPGYAIGGLSVGEPKEAMLEMLACQAPLLPKAKPRYLMGVGALYDLVEAVSLGIDMFDCVMQTRMARTGSAMAGLGRINLKNAAYKRDFAPIADDCSCYVCTNYTKAYLRHLVMGREMLASMLLSYHNIAYTAQYMAKIRKSIIEGGLQSLLARERAKWAELNR